MTRSIMFCLCYIDYVKFMLTVLFHFSEFALMQRRTGRKTLSEMGDYNQEVKDWWISRAVWITQWTKWSRRTARMAYSPGWMMISMDTHNATYIGNDGNFVTNSAIAFDYNEPSDEWQNFSSMGIPSARSDSELVRNFAKVIIFLDNYFLIVIIAVGLVGNTVSFTVFVCTYLNRQSSSVYLAALACADAGFLFCLLVSWSDNIGIHLFNTPGWCPFFVYLTYVCSFLSVWYVVCFSVERYVAVCLPLRRQDTPKRAKITVVCLAIIAAILYNFALWTSRVQDVGFENPYCFPLKKYYKLINYANNIDTFLTLVVPSVIIIITNVRIIYAIFHLQRRRREMELQNSRSPMDLTGDRGNLSRRRYRTTSCQTLQLRVTKLLIVVSSIFLLLNLPSHIMRLYAYFMSITADRFKPTKLFALTQRLFLYVYYVNFAINFFLYSAFGRNFRYAMKHLGRNIRYRFSRCIHSRSSGNSDDIKVIKPSKSSSSSSSKRQLRKTNVAGVMICEKNCHHKESCSSNCVKFHKVTAPGEMTPSQSCRWRKSSEMVFHTIWNWL